ncbi:MAG: ABC transporter substrate-binding protein [Desulfobacula sp.]|uniref:ABC transporter substrate-binding protein n=1 Tax=Desulfobacula sp. TaxID=2593537 RepID=UPI0025C0B827|nr:ABC transporter substrate-binding protein [Desulfobacula sp.]MCD4721205.1 ABC transporter substrate-binding protein [Desulfobacula sp.]
MKRFFLILLGLTFLSSFSQAFAKDWFEIVKAAKGQTVYFNAWGGSQPINEYIAWAAEVVQKKYKVRVVHVKATDIGDVVSRIFIEKAAKKYKSGSVDLMWINGENFKAMKENKLLYGPFSQKLPNYHLVDTENKKTVLYDFTIPVDNMESPWGMAQLVFLYDKQMVPKHPKSMLDLLAFARNNPGRVSYPAIPSFHGTTFIKQALLELIHDPEVLNHPVIQSDFEKNTRPLWDYLDALHLFLWRKAKVFPVSASQMLSLLNDNEIFISLSFNPGSASNAIENGELPNTVRTYIHTKGTIANSHFVGIPFNSSARQGAMVFANFLLSPEAQARKADPKIWGDPTILDTRKLAGKDKALFDAVPKGIATLTPKDLGQVLPEPHVSWVQALEKEWLKRYSK